MPGRQPNVDPQRVGLLGVSLGASLSLSVASRQPGKVKAVVEFFGTLPDVFARLMAAMPPVLILHGDADKLVPVSEAYKLERALKEKNLRYEMKIYPGQGHGFVGQAKADSTQRVIRFLDENLRRAGAATRPSPESKAAQSQ